MTDEITSRTVWNEAGKTGLGLGALCIVCMVLSSLISKLGTGTMMTFLVSILNFIIWAVKFTGCIMLMRFSMKRFASMYPSATRRNIYGLGVASAFLSALIVSAAVLAESTVINPEGYEATIDTILQQYSSMLDANSRSSLESISGNLPTIAFFSNLIYCFVYGWILSAILSRTIQSNDPFTKG